jgi:hypothetical protein
MIASFPFLASSFDNDARTFINTSGAIDRAAINHFVKGIKRLGLWDDMVCWPLRSAQNAGTGSTAYSLGGLGTYNGTLVNSPTWTADGMEFTDDSTDYISTGFAPISEDHLFFAVMQANPQGTQFNAIASTRTVSPAAAGGYTYSQNWNGAWNSILWAASNLENIGSTAITDGTFHSAAFRTNLTSATKSADIAIDAGAYDTASSAISPASPAELLLGNELTTNSRALGGALAFAGYFSLVYSSITDQLTDDLHELMKSTLCKDLSLP